MDLRAGILDTANALGMDPVDLATIISYESNFRPDIWGGKGGQYYGSIQFGPTERQQYGVKVGDPSSQFGAQGAIANYFRDRGYKPGMGLLDAYSIVNAGGPGRYNASDAAAGGMPGTVRDKVEQQMAGHRQKAAALLGQDAAASQGSDAARLDTPSSGRPVGSALPGPPANQYALPLGDRPGEGAGHFGGTGLGTPAEKPFNPYAVAGKDKKSGWGTLGEGIADAATAMAKAGQGIGYNVPAQPGPARIDVQPVASIDPQQAEMRRQQLAMAMQRLNQGALF